MTRWLVLLVLALYLIHLAAATLARLRGKLADALAEPATGHLSHGQALVACTVCGVHVPRQRANAVDAATGDRTSFYCSEACGQRAPAAKAAVDPRSA